MRTNSFFVLVIGIFILNFITSCSSTSSGNNGEKNDLSTSNATLSETTWTYFNTEDDLTHKVTGIHAYIKSTNSHEYDSYNHTARLTLSLQYPGPLNGTMVMLTFEDEREMCKFSDFQGSGFFAVFDNSEVDKSWTLIEMEKNRKSIYMYSSNKVEPFIEKLKSAKKVRIQVNIQDIGLKTFDFDVDGLNWDYN